MGQFGVDGTFRTTQPDVNCQSGVGTIWWGRILTCRRVDDDHAMCRDGGRPELGFPAQESGNFVARPSMMASGGTSWAKAMKLSTVSQPPGQCSEAPRNSIRRKQLPSGAPFTIYLSPAPYGGSILEGYQPVWEKAMRAEALACRAP